MSWRYTSLFISYVNSNSILTVVNFTFTLLAVPPEPPYSTNTPDVGLAALSKYSLSIKKKSNQNQ